MLQACPKCGHAPLPAEQAFPAACPSCGVIFAKIGQPAYRPPRTAIRVEDPSDEAGPADWRGLLLEVPSRPEPMGLGLRAALLVALAAWGAVLIAQDHRSGEIMQSFLHGPLLVFHEAGHVVFALFGEWMAVAGGTLMQLAMPLVLAAALLRRNRDPFGAAVGLWFLGVSLLDVAPYVYDALAPQLMLLSGHTGEEGGHDWIYLLGSLGWLPRAQALGTLVHRLGALTVLASLLWAGWWLRLAYARTR